MRTHSLDLSTELGSVRLENPVLTASGTAGHGAELGAYFDLSEIGALVVKSLSVMAHLGNKAPRVVPVSAGMLNSVGLQGPGLSAWLAEELPVLEQSGARVVVSIWGRRVGDYEQAADLLKGISPSVVAVEVNISCPNVEDHNKMFAHSPSATEEVLSATAGCGLPRWAKLSPNTSDLQEIARAACRGGAEALTLINTVVGLAIDLEARRPVLGGITGGLSGPAIHPVAVRAVYECHAALPDVAIIGVGGVMTGRDAIELLMAGASAIGVGTATFLDPRAPMRILEEIKSWCVDHDVASVRDLIGAAHG